MPSKITQLRILKCWLSWKLCGICSHTYIVKSSLCVRTITYWHTSSHNRIFFLANYARQRILLISFLGVVFGIFRDLLISFQMPSLDALISSPLWPQIPPCPTSLTRFGSSSSTILSCGSTGVMSVVSILTTTCWQTTLVTSWHTKKNCTCRGVLLRLYYESIMTRIVILARYIRKK